MVREKRAYNGSRSRSTGNIPAGYRCVKGEGGYRGVQEAGCGTGALRRGLGGGHRGLAAEQVR